MLNSKKKFTPKPLRRNKKRIRNPYHWNFSSYISFGVGGVLCLLVFLIFYIVFLLSISSMLDSTVSSADQANQNGKTGGQANPLLHAAEVVEDRLNNLGGPSKKELLFTAARAEFDLMRQNRAIAAGKAVVAVAGGGGPVPAAHINRQAPPKQAQAVIPQIPMPKINPDIRAGFMVLGMHRSGTSMMSGLLVRGMGYNTGGPLIRPNFDNKKGFFERIDVVLQNDEFMRPQRVGWSFNVEQYDGDRAIQDIQGGQAAFVKGTEALRFLNDPRSAPWLQKDPRMCICLKTWLKLLNTDVAIVFTYRHPLEVALSLKKREKRFNLEHGLRLWIAYNMRAIQNSEGLCRVLSSNEALLANPMAEIQRISDELTNKCKVPAPPNRITPEVVNEFVDPNLQHNKAAAQGGAGGVSNEKAFATFGVDCVAKEYTSELPVGSPQYEKEKDIYIKAMKIYCDLKSREAYKPNYQWPVVPR